MAKKISGMYRIVAIRVSYTYRILSDIDIVIASVVADDFNRSSYKIKKNIYTQSSSYLNEQELDYLYLAKILQKTCDIIPLTVRDLV